MSQPQSTNPTAPPDGDPARSKRPRDDADEPTSGDLPPATKRRVVLAQDVVFRIMLPSRQIGKVIGNKGSRIQKIREETRATIKIADAVSRHEERVIIISSKDSENTFTDAENALRQIACLILKDDHISTESQKIGAGHVAANTIRLLIAGTQAGGLIGASGQNIENLRNSSGATITVLGQNQMPLCASLHESDRVVQLSGEVPDVLKALVDIGCQLRDNPPKQVISISPAYNYASHRTPQNYVDPSSAEYITMEMMISEAMVGGLIGRCGSNISRIRTESGAAIKVHGGKGEQNLRQVHLGGSAQQVALAKQRIDEYVYSQLMPSGGQQPGVLEAGIVPPIPPVFMPPGPIQAPAYYDYGQYQAPQL
ncbi:RNA-binding KH domain-containing protein PEPPER-like [Apium graveolens]|uniref:RNA-binding KH domain-containing protein PEPPER-like n=1 Tax=Apium graveolens TaxID=4045 RepID=UPI003D7AA5E6